MRAALVLLLLLLATLVGCSGEERVRYWELETTLTFEGPDEPVTLEKGPHCSWLQREDDGLFLVRGWGDPRPEGHVLTRTWAGERPHGDTTGGGLHWWLGDGTILATVEGPTLLDLSWDGHTPVLGGERGFDGWNRTVRYTSQGLDVAETLTLRDHGAVPLAVRTQRSLTCE